MPRGLDIEPAISTSVFSASQHIPGSSQHFTREESPVMFSSAERLAQTAQAPTPGQYCSSRQSDLIWMVGRLQVFREDSRYRLSLTLHPPFLRNQTDHHTAVEGGKTLAPVTFRANRILVARKWLFLGNALGALGVLGFCHCSQACLGPGIHRVPHDFLLRECRRRLPRTRRE